MEWRKNTQEDRVMGDLNEAMGGAFDPGAHEPAADFEPIPAGWYPVEIEKAEIKDTKAGDGKYLKIEHTVVGDKFANRKIWKQINLVNKSEKAVEIGLRELAALGIACGLSAITDTSELLGKQVLAKVEIKKDEGREPDNQIRTYKPLDGAVAPKATAAPAAHKPAAMPPTATTAAPAATKPTASTGAKKRPWEK
jgi:hypothetical protein